MLYKNSILITFPKKKKKKILIIVFDLVERNTKQNKNPTKHTSQV